MKTKQCRRCNKSLPLASFNKDKNGLMGVGRYCKICRREQRSGYRNYSVNVDEKKCRRCGRLKSRSEFSVNRSDKSGLDSSCRERKKKINASRKPRPPAVASKKCERCLILKRGREFHRVSFAKDGLSRFCRECCSKEYKSKDYRVSVVSKRCGRCGEFKGVDSYYRNRRNADGLSGHCKLCIKEKRRSVNNPVSASCKVCSKCGRLQDASAFFPNRQNAIGLRSECKECSRIVANEYQRKRKAVDPLFRFIAKARSVANKLCRYGQKPVVAGQSLLGCSYEKAFHHLCSFFPDVEPSELFGGGGYHIDHNIPLCSARNLREAKILSHWTNLQLLTADENLRKGKSLPLRLVRVTVSHTAVDKKFRERQLKLLGELWLLEEYQDLGAWQRLR